jgi:hypothetical protein
MSAPMIISSHMLTHAIGNIIISHLFSPLATFFSERLGFALSCVLPSKSIYPLPLPSPSALLVVAASSALLFACCRLRFCIARTALLHNAPTTTLQGGASVSTVEQRSFNFSVVSAISILPHAHYSLLGLS